MERLFFAIRSRYQLVISKQPDSPHLRVGRDLIFFYPVGPHQHTALATLTNAAFLSKGAYSRFKVHRTVTGIRV
jgi:hypothetical protein